MVLSQTGNGQKEKVMPTFVQNIAKHGNTDYMFLQGQLLSRYLDGCCYEFAVALSEALGWPMVGLVVNDTIRHVVLEMPGGSYFDARGKFSEDMLGEPFGVKPPYTLKKVSVEELSRMWFVDRKEVERVLRMAEIVWPKLPWKNPRAARFVDFLDKLEDLCRESGVQIAPPAGPSGILIDFLDEDDKFEGFTLHPTYTAGFMFDRRLKK